MRKYDVLVGLFSFGFGLLILFLSREMSMFDKYGVPGERYWPFGRECLFILLGVLQWSVVLKNRLMAERSIDFSSVKCTQGLPDRRAGCGLWHRDGLGEIHYFGGDFYSLHHGADERKACLVCCALHAAYCHCGLPVFHLSVQLAATNVRVQ